MATPHVDCTCRIKSAMKSLRIPQNDMLESGDIDILNVSSNDLQLFRMRQKVDKLMFCTPENMLAFPSMRLSPLYNNYNTLALAHRVI